MYKFKIIHFYCRPCAKYHLKTHPHYRAMKRRAAKRRTAKALLVIFIIAALLASAGLALAGQPLPKCGDGNGDTVICARGLPRCSKDSDTSPRGEVIPAGDNGNLFILINDDKPICWLTEAEADATLKRWSAECRRKPHRVFTTRPNGFPGCWDTVDECGDKVSETCNE